MARKKAQEEVVEETKEIAQEEVVEEKEEQNIIECLVISGNFGKYKTGETVSLAKEIVTKYEKLGYLKRK